MPFYYDANGTRIAFKYNGTMYYYVYNLQGDVTHIIDSSKNIVGTYQYDAWGKILNLNSLTAIAQANPFRYRGYYYDSESGLYYLNSRYYNAEWGRFINADGGIYAVDGGVNGYNLFAYCNNNPINNVDPNGNCPYNGSAGDFRRLEQGLPSMDCTCDQLHVNHVYKTHYTTPEKMLDGGMLFGKIGFSATATNQNWSPIIYSFSDLGNDANLYGFGINLKSWFGIEIGTSTEFHIFVKFQVTPYVHAEASVGIDGIGVLFGTDTDNISTDFEIKGGFGTFFFIFAPQFFVGSQPTIVPQTA